jgi:hypothetical protein
MDPRACRFAVSFGDRRPRPRRNGTRCQLGQHVNQRTRRRRQHNDFMTARLPCRAPATRPAAAAPRIDMRRPRPMSCGGLRTVSGRSALRPATTGVGAVRAFRRGRQFCRQRSFLERWEYVLVTLCRLPSFTERWFQTGGKRNFNRGDGKGRYRRDFRMGGFARLDMRLGRTPKGRPLLPAPSDSIGLSFSIRARRSSEAERPAYSRPSSR